MSGRCTVLKRFDGQRSPIKDLAAQKRGSTASSPFPSAFWAIPLSLAPSPPRTAGLHRSFVLAARRSLQSRLSPAGQALVVAVARTAAIGGAGRVTRTAAALLTPLAVWNSPHFWCRGVDDGGWDLPAMGCAVGGHRVIRYSERKCSRVRAVEGFYQSRQSLSLMYHVGIPQLITRRKAIVYRLAFETR